LTFLVIYILYRTQPVELAILQFGLIDRGGFNAYYLIFSKAFSHCYSKFWDSSSLINQRLSHKLWLIGI
jgi:hypothetical protein